jgi:cysteine desulfurase
MHGAGQESGRRAGTENILQIVGLGKACELAARDFTVNVERMRTTRDSLEAALLSLPDTRINGHAEERLPNTLSVSFKGIAADRILEEIGLDVAASAGAACHSKGVTISHVLEAVGVPMEWAQGTLRFTTGKFTTAEEIQRASASVIAAVTRLRGR